MTFRSDQMTTARSVEEARQLLRNGPMLRALPEELKEAAVDRALAAPHRYGIVIRRGPEDEAESVSEKPEGEEKAKRNAMPF